MKLSKNVEIPESKNSSTKKNNIFNPQVKPLEDRQVMDVGIELLRERNHSLLWREYCSFIDLSLEKFMQIQKQLLLQQITK